MATDFYGSVAAADAYHAARGNTAWIGTSEAKQAALIRASAYIDGTYYNRFSGSKVGGRAQTLQWPRTGATDADGNAVAADSVPTEVEQATYEAVLRELAKPGSLRPDYVAASTVKRVKVDVLEKEYAVSSAGGPADVTPVIGVIDAILAPLLTRWVGPAVLVV